MKKMMALIQYCSEQVPPGPGRRLPLAWGALFLRACFVSAVMTMRAHENVAVTLDFSCLPHKWIKVSGRAAA